MAACPPHEGREGVVVPTFDEASEEIAVGPAAVQPEFDRQRRESVPIPRRLFKRRPLPARTQPGSPLPYLRRPWLAMPARSAPPSLRVTANQRSEQPQSLLALPPKTRKDTLPNSHYAWRLAHAWYPSQIADWQAQQHLPPRDGGRR